MNTQRRPQIMEKVPGGSLDSLANSMPQSACRMAVDCACFHQIADDFLTCLKELLLSITVVKIVQAAV